MWRLGKTACIILLSLGSIPAQAENHIDIDYCSGLTGDNSGDALAAIECVAWMAEQLSQLESNNQPTEMQAGMSGGSIPSGAVLAFDRADGCPLGWKADISAANGRTIVGVDGQNYKLPYVAGRPEYQLGGEETHELSIDEMPSHAHTFDGGLITRGGWGLTPNRNAAVGGSQAASDFKISGRIVAAGGGAAHNNMQPYIVLFYCKKE